ncbi:MAG: heavy metal translocating P-type ATPase [Proteobacteria bacterium]|nr:heavy metal translocating P-type ATPase [Pseudomonadota bacterium]MCL2308144.1 heavy metal translocating P-type ATPase [Pseudomonadota bacterium]
MLVDLTISGMTCAACAARLEKVLNRLDGVSAQVNFATETAHIEIAESAIAVVTADTLIAAVQRAGFDAKLAVDPFLDADAHALSIPQADDEKRAASLKRERNMLIVAALLCLPFLWQMVLMLTGQDHDVLPAWVQFLLAAPIQFVIGARFYKGGWHALRNGAANMDVLVALGTSCAFLLSLTVWLWPLPDQHVYFEASAVIITLVLFGKWLEARARARASTALKSLMALQPNTVLRLSNGTVESVSLAHIRPGDAYLVRAGDTVPVDGAITAGHSALNEAMLTGESLPIYKSIGDAVYAGTVNTSGALECVATAVGHTTLLAGIVRQVAQAQSSRAPIQRLADRVAAVFVPAVLGIAVLTLLANGVALGDWAQALLRATAVLVIACPCALGLATPTALIVGVGRAAQAGILIKNAEALERAERIDTVLFDKTGTLTTGAPHLVALHLHPSSSLDENALLSAAAALEQGVSHPLAQAIVAAAQARSLALPDVTGVQQHSGLGVSADLNGETWRIGSPAFLQTQGVDISAIESLSEASATRVVIARGAQCQGVLLLADTIRDSAAPMVAALRAQRITPYLVTGDHERAARSMARLAGIDEIRTQQSPQDKRALVMALQQTHRVVGMVGDGVNDAPALAQADVSFAMGAGSGSALEAADMTLLRNDLTMVADAIDLSRATLRKIRQNLFFAFVYNVLGIPLAALGFLSPVLAGAAMALSSVSVVTNALLLKRWRKTH